MTNKPSRHTPCLLSIATVAWLLGTDRGWISRAVRTGTLPTVRRRQGLVVPAHALAHLADESGDAQHLDSPGHVVLIDRRGSVQFSASHLMPPLRRNSDQSGTLLVSRVLGSPAGLGRARGRTRWRYRDGIQGDELRAQAVPMDGYLLVVSVTGWAPWEEGFSLPIPQVGPEAVERVCEVPDCGHEFSSFEAPCARCKAPACPRCKRCSCAPRPREQQCSKCFNVLPVHIFEGDRCRDCA
ncbi:hypothetical protein GCM10010483_50740 [Actinokineospora diospyrosa]